MAGPNENDRKALLLIAEKALALAAAAARAAKAEDRLHDLTIEAGELAGAVQVGVRVRIVEPGRHDAIMEGRFFDYLQTRQITPYW